MTFEEAKAELAWAMLPNGEIGCAGNYFVWKAGEPTIQFDGTFHWKTLEAIAVYVSTCIGAKV